MGSDSASKAARTVTVRLDPKQTEALEFVKGRLAEESGEDYTDEQALRIALMAAETAANTDKFADVVHEALGASRIERRR
jgi:hypothetical protein